jgi:redox-sensitive bicupin YhaK (pirin superfamily)
MIRVIPAAERYHFESDWLSTYWHFSFDHYYDPDNVSFGPLRVFNDDTIAGGGGFPEHPHREMEILTYVLAGKLEHRDNLGNRGVIGAGELQRMSAGTGIRHSESNASKTEPLHLLQFWIHPAERGLKPSWEQKQFAREQRQSRLLPVASGRPLDGALRIHQDATVYISALNPGDHPVLELAPGRRAYVFVIEGALALNGKSLAPGDQARVENELRLELQAGKAAELLLIDLP